MAFAVWCSLFGSGVLLARNFKDIALKRRRWGNLLNKRQMMCFVWRVVELEDWDVPCAKEKKELFEKALISEVTCERSLGKIRIQHSVPVSRAGGGGGRFLQGGSSELLESSGNWGTNICSVREQSREHWSSSVPPSDTKAGIFQLWRKKSFQNPAELVRFLYSKDII